MSNMSGLEKVADNTGGLSNGTTSNALGEKKFKWYVFFLLFGVLLAYSNHFENSFQFDDMHTISTNPSIREVDVLRFFKDGTTFSSLPSNQSYRPIITTVNAIDYAILDGLYPGVFHTHIFLTFLITIVLLIVFVRKLLKYEVVPRLPQPRPLNGKQEFSLTKNLSFSDQMALCVGAIFGLLCANAETVNYIIQRAEIEAGMYILAGFVAYLAGGIWRKWHIYMVFPVIGFFAKELAFMFVPLLFVYVLIFEQQCHLVKLFRAEELKKIGRAIKTILPALIITLVAGYFYAKALPETFSTGSSDRWAYLITQPFVIGHYILTFFVPYNLSADTDWTTFTSLSDIRVWIGFAVVALLFWLAFVTSSRVSTRLISFGIWWFLITLAPTSSIIPLAEVMNDHRCFIPYMGLSMSVVTAVWLLIRKLYGDTRLKLRTQKTLWTLFFLFLAANAWGVHERNKVWRDDLSLWKDVTEKSPNNGRGFMNYGLALMARGQYAPAEENFLEAAKLNPDYALVYVNLGILKQAQGHREQAESFFKIALTTSTVDHQAYYYYGKFLADSKRWEEARGILESALLINPTYLVAYHQLFPILQRLEDWDALASASQTALSYFPSDAQARNYVHIAQQQTPLGDEDVMATENHMSADELLNLSLQMFNNGDFENCIKLAELALLQKPDYVEAYNNIGISKVRLGRIEEGIEAYRKALQINPDFELVKNNLAEALKLQKSN